jgi:hypothetical protein
LLSLDSFSQDKNFLGTEMITYGMPYIVFRTKDGERIDVKKSNPMILITKSDYLSGMMKKMSEKEKETLIQNSKQYREYYTAMNVDLGFVSLVPFWVLDQKRGV